MKIALVARTDFCGLGTISRILHEFLGAERTMALCFRPNRFNDSWLDPETTRRVHRNQIDQADAGWLIDGMDCVVSIETFYNAEIPLSAHRRGVKVVLIPMQECLPLGGIGNSFVTHAICPHELCRREVRNTPAMAHVRAIVLPLPIDTSIPFRRRERARTFVHFSKEGDRDGTPAVLAAWSLVKSDARLIVYGEEAPDTRDSRVEFRHSCSPDYWADYANGDVLLHPHAYCGYSCHVHHSPAAGMPVMTSAWWPFTNYTGFQNAIGPIEPDLLARYFPDGDGLLPPSSQALAIQPTAMRRVVICRPTLAFETSPERIAAAVDSIYDSDISAASEEGRAWAEERSFEKLRGRWIEEIAA